MFENVDYVIVGSGFFGAVLAERIANDLQKNVLIIEKENHIGGNCYSELEPQTGIEYHTYGTHIFHTSNPQVYDYIRKFTDFNSYYHQVLTTHHGRVYQMPINLETINSFFGVQLRPFEVSSFLAQKIEKDKTDQPANFEAFAINAIGRDLFNAFIKGYTEKQWGKSTTELPASIFKRLPIRTSYNESYFFDTWQGIPTDGYASIFRKMLTNERIQIRLNTDYFSVRNEIPAGTKIIYSGPIDRYFDYAYGRLEWRSLRFEQEIVQVEDYQGTSVMNFADLDVPYTRIHEPKHLHPERSAFHQPQTLIIREYAIKDDDRPYYPISDDHNKHILQQYQERANSLSDVIIGGRLGDYKYYDMHHTIERALNIYHTLIKK